MRRVLATLVIALGIAGAMTGTTLPAYAKATENAFPAHAKAITFFEADYSGNVVDYDCTAGANYDSNPALQMQKAYNGCSFRAWLHEYTNYVNHGWAYCISPGKTVSIPSEYQFPHNIQITSNRSAC
jgi:hypothetical protein